MIIRNFDIRISEDNVQAIIGCAEENDIYEEVLAEARSIIPIAYSLVDPIALLDIGEFEGKPHGAIYCVTSVGEKLSQWSSSYFDEGDYLKGMLADAIADDCIFQMEHQLTSYLRDICKRYRCGISKRLEAPQDIGIEVQKKALDITDRKCSSEICINESFMYKPVKSLWFGNH